jgi:hypothetical protein
VVVVAVVVVMTMVVAVVVVAPTMMMVAAIVAVMAAMVADAVDQIERPLIDVALPSNQRVDEQERTETDSDCAAVSLCLGRWTRDQHGG